MLRADDRGIEVRLLAGARELFMSHHIGHGTQLLEVKWPKCEADYSQPVLEISGTISPLPIRLDGIVLNTALARIYLHLTPWG